MPPYQTFYYGRWGLCGAECGNHAVLGNLGDTVVVATMNGDGDSAGGGPAAAAAASAPLATCENVHACYDGSGANGSDTSSPSMRTGFSGGGALFGHGTLQAGGDGGEAPNVSDSDMHPPVRKSTTPRLRVGGCSIDQVKDRPATLSSSGCSDSSLGLAEKLRERTWYQ